MFETIANNGNDDGMLLFGCLNFARGRVAKTKRRTEKENRNSVYAKEQSSDGLALFKRKAKREAN